MSVNGNKFNTPMWDRDDEVVDCSVPSKSPAKKRASRDETFCGDVVTAPFFNGTAARANVASALG